MNLGTPLSASERALLPSGSSTIYAVEVAMSGATQTLNVLAPSSCEAVLMALDILFGDTLPQEDMHISARRGGASSVVSDERRAA